MLKPTKFLKVTLPGDINMGDSSGSTSRLLSLLAVATGVEALRRVVRLFSKFRPEGWEYILNFVLDLTQVDISMNPM